VTLYADKGVIADEGNGSRTISPAWIAIRPGRAPEALPETMVKDLQSGKDVLNAWGNEWIAVNKINGPRRYLGKRWVKLVGEDELAYQRLIGIDSRGRWVFERVDPGAPATSSSGSLSTTRPGNSPTTAPALSSRFLILDPTIADPTPKLPGWAIGGASESGWTSDGWPAIVNNGTAYKLKEFGWERLDAKKKESVISTVPSVTTTAPASLFKSADGVAYFDGTKTLRRVDQAGREVSIHLPMEARGPGPVYLVKLANGSLLLMNTPGRVVRLKETKDQSVTVERVFTEKVPNSAIRRFWLDPAGRLCIASGKADLAVFFPGGVITPEIRKMMPEEQLEK
jgi:hypothetical protein